MDRCKNRLSLEKKAGFLDTWKTVKAVVRSSSRKICVIVFYRRGRILSWPSPGKKIRLFARNKGYGLYRACYVYQGCVYFALERHTFPPSTPPVSLILFSSRRGGFCAGLKTSHPETDKKQNKSGLLEQPLEVPFPRCEVFKKSC